MRGSVWFAILRRFQSAAVLQEHGDAGTSERMVADALRQSRRVGAAFHQTQVIPP